MVYAYLQLARDADARRTIEEALKVTGTNPARFTAPYAIAAMYARYAVERGAWREAMQLQPRPTKYPFTEAITYFARALGAARSGDIAAAEKDAEQLASLHKALQAAKNNYGAARAAATAGDRQKAADYFAKLVALSKNADSARPELARAKAYLAQR